MEICIDGLTYIYSKPIVIVCKRGKFESTLTQYKSSKAFVNTIITEQDSPWQELSRQKGNLP